MGCKVESLTNEHVVSLEGDKTVREGAALMASNQAGALVVTEGERVVGLFTERDVLNRVVAEGLDFDNTTLAEVCSRDLVGIDHDSSCQEAAHKMEVNQCRRLLVYRYGRFAGMVGLQQIAHELARQGAGRNRFADVFVGMTVVTVLIIIGLLLSQLPSMLRLGGHIS